jgi:3-oxoacyl-[acyl-carrier protein] reductase
VDLGIAGRSAAVAAASAGLGFASARALAEEGARVAICSRDRGRVEQAAKQIGAVALVADVSTEPGARRFVRDAIAALGRVDILIANAGGPPPGTFASTDLAAYRSALELNLLSTIAMCQEAVPPMCERGWGRVVAITSIGARQPIPFLIASVTARTGVEGFLKVLATEVAPRGVTVNSLQPGVHATDRVKGLGEAAARDVPVGRLGAPEDFGKAAAFLCSEHAQFITGTSLLIDGGAYRGL